MKRLSILILLLCSPIVLHGIITASLAPANAITRQSTDDICFDKATFPFEHRLALQLAEDQTLTQVVTIEVTIHDVQTAANVLVVIQQGMDALAEHEYAHHHLDAATHLVHSQLAALPLSPAVQNIMSSIEQDSVLHIFNTKTTPAIMKTLMYPSVPYALTTEQAQEYYLFKMLVAKWENTLLSSPESTHRTPHNASIEVWHLIQDYYQAKDHNALNALYHTLSNAYTALYSLLDQLSISEETLTIMVNENGYITQDHRTQQLPYPPQLEDQELLPW